MEYVDHVDWSVPLTALVVGLTGALLIYNGHWIVSLPFLLLVAAYVGANLWGLFAISRVKQGPPSR